MKEVVILTLLLLAACTANTDPQINTHLNGIYSSGLSGVSR